MPKIIYVPVDGNVGFNPIEPFEELSHYKQFNPDYVGGPQEPEITIIREELKKRNALFNSPDHDVRFVDGYNLSQPSSPGFPIMVSYSEGQAKMSVSDIIAYPDPPGGSLAHEIEQNGHSNIDDSRTNIEVTDEMHSLIQGVSHALGTKKTIFLVSKSNPWGNNEVNIINYLQNHVLRPDFSDEEIKNRVIKNSALSYEIIDSESKIVFEELFLTLDNIWHPATSNRTARNIERILTKMDEMSEECRSQFPILVYIEYILNLLYNFDSHEILDKLIIELVSVPIKHEHYKWLYDSALELNKSRVSDNNSVGINRINFIGGIPSNDEIEDSLGQSDAFQTILSSNRMETGGSNYVNQPSFIPALPFQNMNALLSQINDADIWVGYGHYYSEHESIDFKFKGDSNPKTQLIDLLNYLDDKASVEKPILYLHLSCFPKKEDQQANMEEFDMKNDNFHVMYNNNYLFKIQIESFLHLFFGSMRNGLTWRDSFELASRFTGLLWYNHWALRSI